MAEATLPKELEAPDYSKLEYTEEIFESPLGGASVTVTGPLGAIGALSAMDFTQPASVFNGLAIGASFIPGIGTIATGIMGFIGGLFGGPDADEVRHDEVMSGLKAISDGLASISSQMTAGFNTLLEAQRQQTQTFFDFTVQLIGDKQVAFRFVNDEIARLNKIYIADLSNLHIDTETELDTIFSTAIRNADALILDSLSGLQAKYLDVKMASLKSLMPIMLSMIMVIEKIDIEFLIKLKNLNQIQADLNTAHLFKVKMFLDTLIGKFRSRLLPMIGRTIKQIDTGQPSPVRAKWLIDSSLDWPTPPTPTNIDVILAYKNREGKFTGKSIIDQMIAYLKIAFGV